MNPDKSEIPETPKKFLDVMIDLETLGTKPGCVILSIGATTFDVGENFGSRELYYTTITRQSCEDAGLTVDQATVDWWDKQDPEAKEEAFMGRQHIVKALLEFSRYLESIASPTSPTSSVRVWGNAASFDLKILEAAYAAIGVKIPWNFRNEMCYRTLKNVFPHVKIPDTTGIKHHALADALYQANHAEAILKCLRESGVYGN